jgi:HSP20 family molecular chaperone IbpA
MAGIISKIIGNEKQSEENFNLEQDFDSNIDYGMDDILDSSDEISLAIDAYEDEDNLYIKAFIPAIDPKEIDIDVSRDTVTISGERFEKEERDYDQYFQKELS